MAASLIRSCDRMLTLANVGAFPESWSTTHVYGDCQQMNHSIRPQSRRKIEFSEEQIQDILHRHTELEQSCQDIADVYGVAKNTIRARLLASGARFDKSAVNSKISRKRKGQSSARKGVKLTVEQRRQIGVKSKGNKYCLGRVLSGASRRKMSESMKKRFADRKRPEAEQLARDRQRSRFKHLLRRHLRQTGTGKDRRTVEALGYTHQQLTAHIEAQFQLGMSWEQRESFHIDHIVPVSVFLEKGIIDPKIVNALINLRPEYPRPNRVKSDQYDESRWESDLARILASLA